MPLIFDFNGADLALADGVGVPTLPGGGALDLPATGGPEGVPPIYVAAEQAVRLDVIEGSWQLYSAQVTRPAQFAMAVAFSIETLPEAQANHLSWHTVNMYASPILLEKWGTQDGEFNLAPISDPTAPVLVLGFVHGAGPSSEFWVNGELAGSDATVTIATQVDAGFTISSGGRSILLRAVKIWDEAPADFDVQMAQLTNQYVPRQVTATWDAATSNGGSPLTGYVVRHISGGTVTETPVGPDVLMAQFEARTGDAVQVVAVNAAGRSAPTEVVVT